MVELPSVSRIVQCLVYCGELVEEADVAWALQKRQHIVPLSIHFAHATLDRRLMLKNGGIM